MHIYQRQYHTFNMHILFDKVIAILVIRTMPLQIVIGDVRYAMSNGGGKKF